jgi:hypothetical protein
MYVVDIDECAESPGLCEQNCVNIWGSYRCSCSQGFSLQHDNRWDSIFAELGSDIIHVKTSDSAALNVICQFLVELKIVLLFIYFWFIYQLLVAHILCIHVCVCVCERESACECSVQW